MYENTLNSFQSIYANKLRSLLSMLGIIIGVSSVVILGAIGNGSKQEIVKKVEEMGTNILTLQANRLRGSSSEIFNEKMLSHLQENIPGVIGITPTISSNGQVVYQKESISAGVLGVINDYFTIKNIKIEYGVNFSQKNEEAFDRVVILGQSIVESLFGETNPLGEKIKIGNNIFEIIGIIEKNSMLDGNVFIPLSTSKMRVTGQSYYSEIIIGVEESENTQIVENLISQELIAFLDVTDTSSLPFRITNQSQMLSSLSSITDTLTLLLSGIAGISLLVGGIGVMNIMLVSVSERTKEIGIRKAIGAGKIDILLQFLTESIVLSLLGGISGLGLSFGVVSLLNSFDITAVISQSSLYMSFGFSVGIGVFFGILPAYKASKLRPIEALRFE